jgi:hypothetical protein
MDQSPLGLCTERTATQRTQGVIRGSHQERMRTPARHRLLVIGPSAALLPLCSPPLAPTNESGEEQSG